MTTKEELDDAIQYAFCHNGIFPTRIYLGMATKAQLFHEIEALAHLTSEQGRYDSYRGIRIYLVTEDKHLFVN